MISSVFVVAVAASLSVFLTALWSTGRIVVATGGRRTAHMASIGLTIALLASAGIGAPLALIQGCAAGLCVASLVLLGWEERRLWPLCLLQASFAALVALALPSAIA
ncbi:MAG: hypothetical protein AAF322_09795 [Pseudomonadota bacterium]